MKILIKDTQNDRIFEFGNDQHDVLQISKDGRSLHYYNLQNGDGSELGDYRFYYKKESDDFTVDYYNRMISEDDKDKQELRIALKMACQTIKEMIGEKPQTSEVKDFDYFIEQARKYMENGTENKI